MCDKDECSDEECDPKRFLNKAFAEILRLTEKKEEEKVVEKKKSRMCKEIGCKIRASYGNKGDDPGYCKGHAREGMINVVTRRCEEDGCEKFPSYGTEWGKAMFCMDHAKPGMRNVISKRCEEDGCDKIPNYGTEWGKRRFCKDHAKQGMFDVKHMQCEEKGCNRRPNYGMEWGKPKFCKNHVKPGMKNVVSKRCEENGCGKIPNYGTEKGKPMFCKDHAKPGMLDVHHPLCEEEGCNTRASYGIEFEKARFCNSHAKEGMKNVIAKLCEEDGCEKQPTYGTEWKKARFCKNHAKPGMIDVMNKRCKSIYCDTIVYKKAYKGYCYRCFINIFPDNPITTNHKTKERAVADHIRKKFPEYTIHLDKRVQDGCSKRRPDILIDFGEHVLIIEIDENQHQSYDCLCENKRLMELFRDIGSRPIIMIRFNPDQYYNHKGKSVPSCWGYTEDKGLCHVKKGQKNAWQRRLDVLEQQVRHVCENRVDKEIHEIHLFYDGWSL